MPNQIDPRTDLSGAFRSLVESFSELAARENVHIAPYRSRGLEYFPALPEEIQRATYSNFERYAAVIRDVAIGGRSIKDDTYVLWRMFQKLGVRPLSELMASIQRDDVVEIYNAQFVQVFRNIRFFAICSYTLDELLCRAFWDLFTRETRITTELVSMATSIFAEKTKGVHHWKTGVHVVDELASPALYHSVIENKIVSPLFNSAGKVEAVVHTFRVISCKATNPAHLKPGTMEHGNKIQE